MVRSADPSFASVPVRPLPICYNSRRISRSRAGVDEPGAPNFMERPGLCSATRVHEKMKYYPAVCDCGAVWEVTDDASGRRRCGSCQQTYFVPRIKKSTAELIESLVKSRRLPSNERCPISGEPADTTVVFTILHGKKQTGIGRDLLRRLLFFAGGVLVLFYDPDEGGHHTPGGNILGKTPMRFSSNSVAALPNASQRKLLEILRSIPVYAYLLDEHRSVYVRVPDDPAGDV